MTFARWELPVAYSMVELSRLTDQVLPRYLCYWIAFNSIYSTVADQAGGRLRPRFRYQNGVPKTRPVDNLQMAHVAHPHERDQIAAAFNSFAVGLKHDLITHPSANFFAHRVPRWQNTEIHQDAHQQRLNGVLNVGYTINDQYPIWSRIDVTLYQQYIQGNHIDQVRDSVSKQLLSILYTIRNNIVHGGKRADDANDMEVIRHGLPLLEMIVLSFLSDPV